MREKYNEILNYATNPTKCFHNTLQLKAQEEISNNFVITLWRDTLKSLTKSLVSTLQVFWDYWCSIKCLNGCNFTHIR